MKHIKIIVYDLKGNMVDTFINKSLKAGKHSVSWNETNHSSRIYFINMISQSYFSSQKITLIK